MHITRTVPILIFLLIVSISSNLSAQRPNLKFEHITIEQGLSQNSALRVIQDRQGFLWIGTGDGLNKYDGRRFVEYRNDPDDPNSLSDNGAWALYEDRRGVLWIGTFGGGLNALVLDSGQFLRYQHDPNDPPINRRAIALEPDEPRYRLLIVDEKPNNRKLLVKLLSNISSPRSGFDLQEATNGQEAIEVWETWKPHLIWMDLRMPVVDGYEATERIRKLETRNSPFDFAQDDSHGERSRTIPVSSFKFHPIMIAVSASVYEENRKKSLEAGCDDFLRKPVQFDRLLELLRTYLHLDWIYGTDAPTITPPLKTDTDPPEIILPPSPDIKNLLELARLGRARDIHLMLNSLEQQDTSFLPLVTKLRKFAKNYRFKQITEFIRTQEQEVCKL
jgi:CheY-like chemotaxis protein